MLSRKLFYPHNLFRTRIESAFVLILNYRYFQVDVASIKNWENKQTQIDFLNEFMKKKSFNGLQDWYRITPNEFKNFGGDAILEHFDNSLSQMLVSYFPKFEWKPWKFSPLPSLFWNDTKNRRAFLDDIFKELQFQNWEDWYRISFDDIAEAGGTLLLRKYGNSYIRLLVSTYDYPWEIWKFRQVPANFWKERDNQAHFLHSVAKKFDIKPIQNYVRISKSMIKEEGGTRLLDIYKDSIQDILTSAFPDEKWNFPSKPLTAKIEASWREGDSIKTFMEHLGKKLGINQQSDWYNIRENTLRENGGERLLNKYGNICGVLNASFPEYNWKMYDFTFPPSFWEIKKNQENFLKYIQDTCNIKKYEDWYKLGAEDIISFGGKKLLELYEGSISNLLASNFPEFDWKPWKFRSIIPGYWLKEINVINAIKYAESELGIKKKDDWHLISGSQIQSIGLGSLLRHFGGLQALLNRFYPHHHWKIDIPLSKRKYLAYRILHEKIFPNEDIRMDYIHPYFRYQGTNMRMQLGIYLPQLKLAFEYKGSQNYLYNNLFGSPDLLQKRFIEKKSTFGKEGITIIDIPYWWDNSEISLRATISRFRPDLIPSSEGIPIPETHNSLFASKDRKFNLQIIDNWKDENPIGWYMSRFPNGIRCYWDGKGSIFLENNLPLNHVPDYIIEQFPKDIPLDGILSCSSGVNELSRIIFDRDPDIDWKEISFKILDAPTKTLLPFENRFDFIKKEVKESSNLQILEATICNSENEFRNFCEVKDEESEEILLRKAWGRSYELGSWKIYSTLNYEVVRLLKHNIPHNLALIERLNGEVVELSNVPDYQITEGCVLTCRKEGENWIFHQCKPDVNWEIFKLIHFHLPFTLSEGSSGIRTKCRVCDHQFANKNELRVNVWGIFAPANSTSHIGKLTICATKNCLTEGNFTKQNQRLKIYHPPFDGKIAVPSHLKEQIPSIPDIDWKIIE